MHVALFVQATHRQIPKLKSQSFEMMMPNEKAAALHSMKVAKCACEEEKEKSKIISQENYGEL